MNAASFVFSSLWELALHSAATLMTVLWNSLNCATPARLLSALAFLFFSRISSVSRNQKALLPCYVSTAFIIAQGAFTAVTEQRRVERQQGFVCMRGELTVLGEFCLFVRVYTASSCKTNRRHQHWDDLALWLPARQAWQLHLIQQITACLLGLFFFFFFLWTSLNTFWRSRGKLFRFHCLNICKICTKICTPEYLDSSSFSKTKGPLHYCINLAT